VGGARRRAGTASTLVDHFCEIALAADFLDEMELALVPIDGILFIFENLLEKIAAESDSAEHCQAPVAAR